MKNRTKWLAVFLVLLLLLTGCGKAGSGEETQTPASDPDVTKTPMPTLHVPGQDDTQQTDETEPISEAATEPGETATEPAPEEPAKSATLIVYMNGNGLEDAAASAQADLAQMAAAWDESGRVNLLILTGGFPNWTGEEPVEDNALLLMTSKGFIQTELFSPMSMGAPENLTRLLNYALAACPAEEYDLVLWGCGCGPVSGFGADRLSGGDALTLAELKSALEASNFGPENRLGFIGFDAGLMASVETAFAVEDYARYLAASQEAEPVVGWDYAFVSDLGKVSALDLTRRIAGDYLAGAENYAAGRENYHPDLTFSVTDLGRVGELKAALNDLFAEAAGADYDLLASARANAKSFSAGTRTETDLIDAGSMLDGLRDILPGIVSRAEDALDEAVVCSKTNVEGCSGLSLYSPFYNKQAYQDVWRQAYRELGMPDGFVTYQNRFEQTWLGSDRSELFRQGLTPKKDDAGQSFTLQLTPEQAKACVGGQYYILRQTESGLFRAVYASRQVTVDNGLLTARFEADLICVGTRSDVERTPVFAQAETASDDAEIYSCEGILETASGDPTAKVRIRLRRDLAANRITVLDILPVTDAGGVCPQAPVELRDGALRILYPAGRYMTYTSDGRIPGYMDWPAEEEFSGIRLQAGEGPEFTFEPMTEQDDSYYLVFEVTDTQGVRTCSTLIPIWQKLDPDPQAEPESQPGTQGEPETEPESEPESPTEPGGQTEELPVTTLDFPASGELPLGGLDRVSCSLRLFRNGDLGTPVLLGAVQNDGGSRVELRIADVRINDQLADPGTVLPADPGTRQTAELRMTEALLALHRITGPWTLEFTVSIAEPGSAEALLPEARYRLNMPAAAALPEQILPYMGMAADRQQLLSEDGFTVTLLGAGLYVTDRNYTGVSEAEDALTIRLLAENRSSSERSFCLIGAELNGLQFADEMRVCRLGPGQKLPVELKLTRDMLDGCTEEGASGRDLIRSVSSLSVPMVLDGVWYDGAVDLSAQGSGETPEPDGTLVFDDDSFSVWAELPASGAAPERCGLWIRNKTGTEAALRLGGASGAEAVFRIGRNGLIYRICPGPVFAGSDPPAAAMSWLDLWKPGGGYTSAGLLSLTPGPAQPEQSETAAPTEPETEPESEPPAETQAEEQPPAGPSEAETESTGEKEEP